MFHLFWKDPVKIEYLTSCSVPVWKSECDFTKDVMYTSKSFCAFFNELKLKKISSLWLTMDHKFYSKVGLLLKYESAKYTRYQLK